MNRPENIPEVNLTSTGFVTSRHIRDMKVADEANVFAQRFDQIPLHDLHVIEVEENFDEGVLHCSHNVKSFSGAVQIIVGVIVTARIQRLDFGESVYYLHDNRHPCPGRHLAGVF